MDLKFGISKLLDADSKLNASDLPLTFPPKEDSLLKINTHMAKLSPAKEMPSSIFNQSVPKLTSPSANVLNVAAAASYISEFNQQKMIRDRILMAAAAATISASNKLPQLNFTQSAPFLPPGNLTQAAAVANTINSGVMYPHHPTSPNTLASLFPSLPGGSAQGSQASSPLQIHQPGGHPSRYQTHMNGGPSPVAALGGKRKKPRTSFTRLQICELEKRFHQQKYLASGERAGLATRLNMTDSQVKTWFQNRRTKWRRQSSEEREAERQVATQLMIGMATTNPQSAANKNSEDLATPPSSPETENMK